MQRSHIIRVNAPANSIFCFMKSSIAVMTVCFACCSDTPLPSWLICSYQGLMRKTLILNAQQCSKQKALQCMQHSKVEQYELPTTEQHIRKCCPTRHVASSEELSPAQATGLDQVRMCSHKFPRIVMITDYSHPTQGSTEDSMAVLHLLHAVVSSMLLLWMQEVQQARGSSMLGWHCIQSNKPTAAS